MRRNRRVSRYHCRNKVNAEMRVKAESHPIPARSCDGSLMFRVETMRVRMTWLKDCLANRELSACRP
jgi:hypothetical protein